MSKGAMPSTRITIVKNTNQTVRSVMLLQTDDEPEKALASVLEAAEKKLRIRKPSRIFLDNGTELTDSTPSLQISKDAVLMVSAGEAFIGKSQQGQQEQQEQQEQQQRMQILGSSEFQSKHVEPQALLQLSAMSKLAGITRAVGMPDLHPGDKYPIGAAFESMGCIYPALVGGDVGCGMALFQTRLPSSTNPKRICDKLRGIEGRWASGNPRTWLAGYGIVDFDSCPMFEDSLGTIGGGNHFAEIQQVESVLEKEIFTSLGLEEDKLVLLVHSGSRGLGKHIAKDQPLKLVEATPKFDSYLDQHNMACNWARANRDLIADRIFSCLNATNTVKILDIWHNNVTKKLFVSESGQQTGIWIHRKGAAPSDQGPIVIPGSRGALSYLVVPVGEQRDNLFSVAHGAGRRLTRASALARNQNKARTINASAAILQETTLGSRVICEDFNLLFEEAPEAYKDVEAVVEELVHLGIVKIIATYRPVVTYKKRTD